MVRKIATFVLILATLSAIIATLSNTQPYDGSMSMIEYYCSPTSLFLGINFSGLGFWCNFIVVGTISVIGALILYLAYEYIKTRNQNKESVLSKLERLEPLQTLQPTRQPLNLNVTWGRNDYVEVMPGLPLAILTFDVINNETRKILDLEAYFVLIHQSTESQPDDWSITNSLLHFRASRLEWKDGKYSIDIVPGFPESHLRIVGLDMASSEVAFIHEGRSKNLPSLQQDAMYKIVVEFKGKLDGNDPEYRFFQHKTYFVCSPKNSQIGGWVKERNNPNLPDWLRNRINLTLKAQNRSPEDDD